MSKDSNPRGAGTAVASPKSTSGSQKSHATTGTHAARALPLEPATQEFINAVAAAGGKQLFELSPAEAHQVLTGLQSESVALQPVDLEDTIWPVGPTGSTNIRIVRPKGSMEILPLVMFFHGGGWVLGDKITHDRLVRELAIGVNATIVFVDYINSPAAKYPTQNEQAFAAMQYAVAHARELRVDGSRLALVGDSVGGNMVAAVTLMNKERKGPRIAYQILFYPVVEYMSSAPSMEEFKDGPWLTARNMQWMFDLQGLNGTQGITAYPLRATIEQLRDLPDALIIVDGDILRDDAEAYARKLAQAGVRVTSVRYNGTVHDFVMLNPLEDTPAARGAIQQAITHLKSALKS